MGLYALHNPGAPKKLRLGSLELTAFSISGVSTYVLAPDLDACFDLGHCPLEATRLRHVLLSHTHQDHCTGAHRHLSLRRMYGARPSRIHCPAPSAPHLRDLFRAFDRLEGREPGDYDDIIVGVTAGESIRLSGRFEVRTFEVAHRISSLGFTVVEARRKLKAHLLGLPGPEIAAARARGEDLYDISHHKPLTYIGDSTIETLERHPELGESEILFLEATHLPGTDPEVSRTYGHTNLEQIIALAHESPQTFASPHIVLKHFSTRYSREEIVSSAARLPGWLREKTTLLI
jgi:ribonuclease BN (tRNA processing enzyme)